MSHSYSDNFGLRWLARSPIVWASAVFGITAGGASSASAATAASIAIREDQGQSCVVVQGVLVQEGSNSSLSTGEWTIQQWHELLRVSVDGDPADGGSTDGNSTDGEARRQALPIFGSYQLADGEIHFRPRFAFRPGVIYRATYSPAQLPGGHTSARPVEYRFTIPSANRQTSTFVQAVYPTAEVLPENLLKLYVCFSAPMRQGVALEHVRLVRGDGKLLADAFVNVGQELWDRSGKQLTLLFDPGRIKHGLRPREELGPVLQQGADYELRIDAAWNDAHGQPLQRSFKKQFSVSAPDSVPPDPARWKVKPPAAGTDSPLEIEFNEPMDYALAQHSIEIVTPGGSQVVGEVSLTQQERIWRLRPKSAWTVGNYSIVIDGRLEDLAAHSLGRPFEVVIDRDKKTPQKASKTITLPLWID